MKKRNTFTRTISPIFAALGILSSVFWIEDFISGDFESTLSAVKMLILPIGFFAVAWLPRILGKDVKSDDKTDGYEEEDGEIHSDISAYSTEWEDGWQKDRDLSGAHNYNGDGKEVRGTQVGISGETDDFRIVIPVLIGFTVLFAVISAVLIILVRPFGLVFALLSLVCFIGIWAKAPYKKWKNQAKKLREEKERGN